MSNGGKVKPTTKTKTARSHAAMKKIKKKMQW
jgi:hypothetical protein